MRFLHFILSHSVFIACCAAALCFQTNILLKIPHNPLIYGFIFFSTLCSYNFYWLLSKFYFNRRKGIFPFLKKEISLFTILVFSGAATFYCLRNADHLITSAAVGFFLTLLYSLPLWPFSFSKKIQKVGFFKTILLAFTWAFATTAVPASALTQVDWISLGCLLIARFFFMLLLCIIFDQRDVYSDKIRGLHSLATDLKSTQLNIIIHLAFACYFISGLLLRYYFHDTAQLIAFTVTGIIVWLTYRLSLKPQPYVFYYFIVDGLMILSALGTYFAELF